MKLTPLKDLKVFLGILAAVSIPAGITLSTIDTARRVISPVEHSSPLGYTWSLLLFLVPVAAIVIWLFKYQEEKMIRKSQKAERAMDKEFEKLEKQAKKSQNIPDYDYEEEEDEED